MLSAVIILFGIVVGGFAVGMLSGLLFALLRATSAPGWVELAAIAACALGGFVGAVQRFGN